MFLGPKRGRLPLTGGRALMAGGRLGLRCSHTHGYFQGPGGHASKKRAEMGSLCPLRLFELETPELEQ